MHIVCSCVKLTYGSCTCIDKTKLFPAYMVILTYLLYWAWRLLARSRSSLSTTYCFLRHVPERKGVLKIVCLSISIFLIIISI